MMQGMFIGVDRFKSENLGLIINDGYKFWVEKLQDMPSMRYYVPLNSAVAVSFSKAVDSIGGQVTVMLPENKYYDYPFFIRSVLNRPNVLVSVSLRPQQFEQDIKDEASNKILYGSFAVQNTPWYLYNKQVTNIYHEWKYHVQNLHR